MSNDKLAQKIGSVLLTPISIIQLLLIGMFFSTPFVWIWHSWEYAWKIGLTGFLGAIINYWLYKIVKEASCEVAAELRARFKDEKPKSNFQQRLEDKINEQKKAQHE